MARGVERADLLERHRARMNLAIDALLADATRDELRVLRAEIEDQDRLSIHGAAMYYRRPAGRPCTKPAALYR